MPGTYSAIEVPFPHPKSQVNQYESSQLLKMDTFQLVPNFVKKVTSHIHTLQQSKGPAGHCGVISLTDVSSSVEGA